MAKQDAGRATAGDVWIETGLVSVNSGHVQFAERRFDRFCYAAAMADCLPPGWPEAVAPPGSEGWEATAVAWLLDLAPRYRQYEMMRRYPVILAYIARHHVHGGLAGAREGYRTIRAELVEQVPPHAVDAALKAYRAEGRRLAAIERAVDLVERALRGEDLTYGRDLRIGLARSW